MKNYSACDIRIGTSGWHYKHWIGTFYPPKSPASKMLTYYCGRFDTVELNNSFYRLPKENALISWRDSTPANFYSFLHSVMRHGAFRPSANQARRMHAWQRDLKAIYVYFDNDEAGYAARDALRLKSLVADSS